MNAYAVDLKVTMAGSGSAVAARVKSAVQPARFGPVMGRAIAQRVRSHLFEINGTKGNALGGRRTNFYAAAARSTAFTFDGDYVIVSISQIGIAQRYYGGKIRAKKGKFLTIPVAPEAHGKRAKEFGDLELVFGPGGVPWALATKGDRRVQITQNAKGKLVRKMIGRHGVILFRLVKSVTQKGDKSVLPTPDQLWGAGIIAFNEYLARAIAPEKGENK